MPLLFAQNCFDNSSSRVRVGVGVGTRVGAAVGITPLEAGVVGAGVLVGIQFGGRQSGILGVGLEVGLGDFSGSIFDEAL
jgi:hypothetical protein